MPGSFGVGRQIDLDLRDGERMAERDQFVRALGRHDAGDAGGAEHVAFFRIALAHDVEGRRLHHHATRGHRLAFRHGLGRDVDHARFARGRRDG